MPSANPPTTRSAVSFRLRTLGATGLYAEHGETPVLGPGKPFALLTFLACVPGRRASRESLIDLLWSDTDPDRARLALRQTLFQLRRLLGDETISGTEELTLTKDVDADRDRFLSALDQGELECALETYHGAFLPAFGVPGGASFEQWADLERGRLETGFVRCAELLVRRLLNQARMKEARQLARRVRDVVPHAEATGRLVLEAAIAGNDFVTAAMEADALEQWATREAVVLEPATRAAVARARRAVPEAEADRKAFALVAELTGREKEFFAITSAWDAVRSGPARHLHVSAPAGLGKTRLLHDAVARLSASGARIVQLRGTPGDRDVPFAFASDLAAAVAELPGAAGVAPASASTLVALNPALSMRVTAAADSATGEEMLRRRILALTDLVHAVASEQRFVLAIDDLHWIDLPSFRVLEGVLSRLSHAHVLCLTASRPERATDVESSTLLTLSALSASQVSALVAALGSLPLQEAWSAAFVSGLHEATRGSPLLVLETLHLAIDQGTLSLDDNEWRCLDDVKLRRLLKAGEALRERVRALPDAQGSLLALLATAGMAFTGRELALATGSTEAELAERLEPLERLGLVVQSSSGWMPAHDEIAEAARAAQSRDAQIAADQRIGEYFARTAGDDPNQLLRAVRHFVAANDMVAVQQMHRQYVRLARERGDRRSYREIASELIGADASSPQVSELVADLPRSWRVGLWSRARRTAAVSAFLVIPALAAGAWRVRAANDANLQRLLFVDSTRTTTSVTIRPDEFDGRNTLLQQHAVSDILAAAAMAHEETPPAISPDGRAMAWTQDSGDSTTLDVWLRTPVGVRRLTREARDDLVNDWLPDGSAVVGTTNRWSPRDSGNYDIAVFDTATGSARQVTRGPEHDTWPYVSPDGTRVAFQRESDDFPPRVCVTAIDGLSEPDCRLIGGLPSNQLLGWSGLDELAIIVDGGSPPHALVVYDWSRNTQRAILGPQARWGRLSPDRRWVVAALRVKGIRGDQDWVAPLEHPSEARPIDLALRGFNPILWWEGTRDQSLLIDHIEFNDTASVVLLGVGTRLGVRALTVAHTEVPFRAPVRWSSSDTLIATVDTTGEVRPHGTGDVTITASLAGWRSAVKRIHVGGAPPATVLNERWDGNWRQRWIPWGDPQPLVTNGPGGIRGFLNNGDGTYVSIGVLRQTLSARRGLGVEMQISSAITRREWQRVVAVLVSGIDTAALLAADPRKSPPTFGVADTQCGINFPGPSRWGETRVSASGSVSQEFDLGERARPLRTGAWWTLRLQILPDGRCGIAINNRVLWISPEPIALEGEFRLRLGDNSKGTKILHGPLQIWTGVRTDIQWSQAK